MIAPLLIVQWVANRSAFTSHTISTGHASSFNVRRQEELTGGDDTPLGGYLMSSVGWYEGNRGGLGVAVKTTSDLHLDHSEA